MISMLLLKTILKIILDLKQITIIKILVKINNNNSKIRLEIKAKFLSNKLKWFIRQCSKTNLMSLTISNKLLLKIRLRLHNQATKIHLNKMSFNKLIRYRFIPLPSTVRKIILSHNNKMIISTSNNRTHQFLTKIKITPNSIFSSNNIGTIKTQIRI